VSPHAIPYLGLSLITTEEKGGLSLQVSILNLITRQELLERGYAYFNGSASRGTGFQYRRL
jgi:hypothetical protein